MERLLAPDRRRDAQGGERTARVRGARLRLRTGRPRRGRRGWPRASGPPPRAHSHRTVRAERRMTMPEDGDLVLGGNAVAGALAELYGDDMTTVRGERPG